MKRDDVLTQETHRPVRVVVGSLLVYIWMDFVL